MARPVCHVPWTAPVSAHSGGLIDALALRACNRPVMPAVNRQLAFDDMPAAPPPLGESATDRCEPAADMAGRYGGPLVLACCNDGRASSLHAFAGLGPKRTVVVDYPEPVSIRVQTQLASGAGRSQK